MNPNGNQVKQSINYWAVDEKMTKNEPNAKENTKPRVERKMTEGWRSKDTKKPAFFFKCSRNSKRRVATEKRNIEQQMTMLNRV